MSDTPTPEADTLPGTEHGTPPETPGRPGGFTMTMADAIRMSNVSESTMRRRLTEGAIPGAYRRPGGAWAIPISGLITAGLVPKVSPPPSEQAPPPPPTPEISAPHHLHAELAAAQAEIVRLRADAEMARALAEERARHVDDLRAALEAMSRALTPAPITPEAAPSVTSTEATSARRRWWGRG